MKLEIIYVILGIALTILGITFIMELNYILCGTIITLGIAMLIGGIYLIKEKYKK